MPDFTTTHGLPVSLAPETDSPADIDWRLLGPDTARVNRGRQMLWRIAIGGVLLNALIGMVGVTLHFINAGAADSFAPTNYTTLYISALLMGSSLIIFLLMRRAARQQVADQSLLMEAFHGMIAPQVIVDPAGSRIVANRAYMNWMGGRGDNVESALYGYFGSDPLALSELQSLAKGARAGQLMTAEISHRLSNGESEWRRVVARPLTGWDGYIIWRLEDISERRRIEERLREEQTKLTDFMAQAPVGIYSVDQAGRFLYVNQTLADWLGCDPADLTDGANGATVRLHDVLAEPPQGANAYALASGPNGERRGDLIMKGRQGRLFPVSIAQTIVPSEDGFAIRTRSVVRDLTPERAYQEALNMSEQRFERLFKDAPIGITLVDAQTRIIECNQAFVQLTGESRTELVGRGFAELVHADERGELLAYLAEVQKSTGITRPRKFEMGGDKPRILMVYARRFFTAQTGDSGLMLHFIEVTEQEKLQSQFVQSQKMQAVGQLAGGIAHDFNNLLTAMGGFCDLLLLRHKPGDQSFSDLMQIKQNANRAASLVRQLLAFSRQQTLQPTVLDLTDEIADLSFILRRLIGANIELKVVHERDLWPVNMDRTQFEQVIINLVVNARDAMKEHGGTITVRTANHTQTVTIVRDQDEMPVGEYVAISVSDTGHGIPADIMERIFEPFFSTKEVGAGTGLGLSTVYGIVRQTGGFLAVDSTVGEGTEFTVFLPHHMLTAAEKAKPVEPIVEAAADLTGAGSILLVEDEDAVRTFSARALRNKGYNVIEAASGEEALLRLVENDGKIDLVVSDVVMPQMDGPTLIRQIRKTHPTLKVIFISGYTEDRLREQFEAGEVIHFLSKPFALKQLAQKVKDVIELETA